MKKFMLMLGGVMLMLGAVSCDGKSHSKHDESTRKERVSKKHKKNRKQKEYNDEDIYDSDDDYSYSGSSLTQAEINELKTVARSMNAQCPMDAGSGVTLTGVNYNVSKQQLVYTAEIDLDTKPTASEVRTMKSAMVSSLRGNAAVESLLNRGVSYHYIYYNPSGLKLCEVNITRGDL